MSDEKRPDPRNPVLTADDIDGIVARGTRHRLKDGEPLFRAGERRGGFHIVLKGAIEIVDRTGDAPQVIEVHGPGQFTGDIDIVRRRRPVVDAVARGETEVVGLASEDVRRIIAERPRLGDTILRAFVARREQLVEMGVEGIRVIGSAASRDAFRVREFLSRNQVPFGWIDIGDEVRVTEFLRDFGVDAGDLTVVMTAGQPLLRNPTTRELADTLGLRRRLGTDVYDLVIVGGGPAGLGAAVYAASEGLRTVVLEAVAPGGQAGSSAHARSILIATGADYRKLDVPGRETFDGAGVYYSATPMELTTCRGRDVAVVGGGNSAGQAAMFLAENTRRVWILLRGDDLRKSMSSYLADRIEATRNVEILYDTEIREFRGAKMIEGIVVESSRSHETRMLDVAAVFSFIGATPRTRWLPPTIETDTKGFILSGRAAAASPQWRADREPYFLETTHPGVFAAGDVRLHSTPRIASAVGEGAMAVKFVHAFLGDVADRQRS